ncbi:MAG: biopolymer transport protein ExbD [Bradymonadia bacterium]|jgi:biopolymer transport protein ExbD
MEHHDGLTDEEFILEQRAKAARRKKGKRDPGPEPGLNINSMMDMMVIILCFLLKSVGAEPIQINQNDDLRLPFSTSELPPEDMLVLNVTKRWVMVGDDQVTPINEGTIDASFLQSAESAIIPELQQKIEEELNEQEQWAQHQNREVERVVTIISDSQTPYRILTQVMITSAAAGIQNFKFAILQRPQGSGVVQPTG